MFVTKNKLETICCCSKILIILLLFLRGNCFTNSHPRKRSGDTKKPRTKSGTGKLCSRLASFLSFHSSQFFRFLQTNYLRRFGRQGTWCRGWLAQIEALKEQWPAPGCGQAFFVKIMVCCGCEFLQAQKTWFRSLLFRIFCTEWCP